MARLRHEGNEVEVEPAGSDWTLPNVSLPSVVALRTLPRCTNFDRFPFPTKLSLSLSHCVSFTPIPPSPGSKKKPLNSNCYLFPHLATLNLPGCLIYFFLAFFYIYV